MVRPPPALRGEAMSDTLIHQVVISRYVVFQQRAVATNLQGIAAEQPLIEYFQSVDPGTICLLLQLRDQHPCGPMLLRTSPENSISTPKTSTTRSHIDVHSEN